MVSDLFLLTLLCLLEIYWDLGLLKIDSLFCSNIVFASMVISVVALGSYVSIILSV